MSSEKKKKSPNIKTLEPFTSQSKISKDGEMYWKKVGWELRTVKLSMVERTHVPFRLKNAKQPSNAPLNTEQTWYFLKSLQHGGKVQLRASPPLLASLWSWLPGQFFEHLQVHLLPVALLYQRFQRGDRRFWGSDRRLLRGQAVVVSEEAEGGSGERKQDSVWVKRKGKGTTGTSEGGALPSGCIPSLGKSARPGLGEDEAGPALPEGLRVWFILFKKWCHFSCSISLSNLFKQPCRPFHSS